MKRNTLTTAVLAGLTGIAGMAGVANAVNVNPDGLGQVLLFPYYTARGGNDTLISIVNTSDRGKALKIRFIEALNSREVLDFNIYMSPFDVWTSAITPDAAGGGKMVTRDTSCTVPYFVGDAADAAGVAVGSEGAPPGEQRFLDFGYNAAAVPSADFDGTVDGGPDGIERTLSGYIEVIEMASFDGVGANDTQPTSAPTAVTDVATVAWWAKHVETDGAVVQVPNDCDKIVDLWRPVAAGTTSVTLGALGSWLGEDTQGKSVSGADVGWGLASPSGGIYGSATIVDPTDGLMFSYNATAIDGFWLADTSGSTAGSRHTDPGDIQPNLQDATNKTSFAFVNNEVQQIDWSGFAGPGAVNAVLTIKELMNEYNAETALAANTEWVLTFPTKGFHTDDAVGGPNEAILPLSSTTPAIPPFTELWTLDQTNGSESCEELSFRFWDREEMMDVPPPGEPGGVIVSPPPPPGPVTEDPRFELCREANVIRIVSNEAVDAAPSATEILGEPDRAGDFPKLGYTNLNLPEGFESGWINFNFGAFTSVPGVAESTGTANAGDNVVEGLPVIGFAVTTFENGDLGSGVRANYGGTFQHRGTRGAIQSGT